MDQLILDTGETGVLLPESIKDGYGAWEEDLSVEVTMIPGNMVRELRGVVWRIKYQYGFFDTLTKNRVIYACHKGQREPILCAFLPPDGTEMVTSEFFVTSFQSPKFMWSRDDNGTPVPLWADFAVELREVDPHD